MQLFAEKTSPYRALSTKKGCSWQVEMKKTKHIITKICCIRSRLGFPIPNLFLMQQMFVKLTLKYHKKTEFIKAIDNRNKVN